MGGMSEEDADSRQLILVVEDEPDNREIMRTVIEDVLGLRAVLTSDGETAVRLATELQPSAILMDLMIPVLDGFEAITRLKSSTLTASIPVVAITALGRPTDRQRALDRGADDYLSKPFDLDVLSATLEKHVGAPKR
jgi:CheY-like chemotaxis protein